MIPKMEKDTLLSSKLSCLLAGLGSNWGHESTHREITWGAYKDAGSWVPAMDLFNQHLWDPRNMCMYFHKFSGWFLYNENARLTALGILCRLQRGTSTCLGMNPYLIVAGSSRWGWACLHNPHWPWYSPGSNPKWDLTSLFFLRNVGLKS